MKEFIKSILKKSPIPLSKNHLYDIQTTKILKQLKPNSNCIDVGCFKGEILDLMNKYAPKGQHFGIEPVPQSYANLSAKFKNISNCTILNIAASDAKGETQFNYVVSNPSYSGLIKRDYDRPTEKDEQITVQTERLDEVIPNDLPIDLIKIDVEGAEYQVLQGAKNIIQKYQPMVIFEHGLGASNHYGTTPEMVYEYFADLGMNIYNLNAYLDKKEPLSLQGFSDQYHNKDHYYFVAK